jgi:nicotinamidase-related amidase
MDVNVLDEPAPGGTALLIVDMINDLDFAEGRTMRPHVAAVADAILRLRGAADALHVPVIYVNDNYGHWHSERSRIVEHCMRDDSIGREIVARVQPREEDFFVIKSQFSGFYASSLPVLLPKLRANRLILTGIAADICVLFTAADAHMRDYGLWVPADAVASGSAQRTEWALDTMRNSMAAETRATTELALDAWVNSADAPRELLPEGRRRAGAGAR